MAMKRPSTISSSRQLLENQYAHLDDVGRFSAIAVAGERTTGLKRAISTARRKLQNPYAFLDGDGAFGALILEGSEPSNTTRRPKPSIGRATTRFRRLAEGQIEEKAKDLQRRIWRNQAAILGNTKLQNPIDLLDPGIAFDLLGFDYDLSETLGNFRIDRALVEVAGMVDTTHRTVRISRRFPDNVQNFTAAHELGHIVLSHATGQMHRDRPADGASISRNPMEFEADRFATYYLMPEKLVRSRFKSIFLADQFVLDETTAFALNAGTPKHLGTIEFVRDLSRILAGAERYNGVNCISLADQFRVSIGAMAIRLEELNLVAV